MLRISQETGLLDHLWEAADHAHRVSLAVTSAVEELVTRSSATAKSTARPSCLVGVLYDIYRETNNRSTANQPLVRNWP